MLLDFDTFLVALYTVVDDLYKKHFAAYKPVRPGPDPQFTDSEVLTLVICSQWFGSSERWVVRHAHEYWRCYFPKLVGQSSINRRARDLAGVLVQLVPSIAAHLQAECAAYQVFDGLPVELMRKCRGRKNRVFCFNEAAIGRGGSDRDWYYGCKLLICVTPEGVISGFVLGPANTEEHWLADALLCWRHCPEAEPWEPADVPPANKRDNSHYVGPTGPIWPREGAGALAAVPYITDGGFRGVIWTRHWADDYRAMVFTPQSYKGEKTEVMKHQHACWRHVVETVNDLLLNVFHLSFPGARSPQGLLVRVAAKLVALNLGICLNRLFNGPDFALATLFNC